MPSGRHLPTGRHRGPDAVRSAPEDTGAQTAASARFLSRHPVAAAWHLTCSGRLTKAARACGAAMVASVIYRGAMPVEIEIITTRELAILRCRGRLVLGDGATLLRDVARRALAAGQAVALDLGRVTQMDAHGTGVIAELCAFAHHQGRALLLARVNDRVRRLLRLTRLDAVVPGLLHTGVASQSSAPRDATWACHAVANLRA